MQSASPGTQLLDDTVEHFQNGSYTLGLSRLYAGLLDLKERLPEERWRQFAKDEAIEHPLRQWIHRDPMSKRSFEKPRGYAGDAVLLDYIYGLQAPLEDEGVASAVYRFSINRPAATAVRERRHRIAQRIDSMAAERDTGLRVLSIAAGHLREGHLARVLEQGRIEEFVAVDSDAASAERIEREFPSVRVRNVSFTALLRDRELRDRFDLVYSAGLFDYLQEPIAQRLTRSMFGMLRPRGSVLLTNFLPTVVDAGFMESYMGWELIYRDLQELERCAGKIEANEIGQMRAYADSHRAIGYLEIDRR